MQKSYHAQKSLSFYHWWPYNPGATLGPATAQSRALHWAWRRLNSWGAILGLAVTAEPRSHIVNTTTEELHLACCCQWHSPGVMLGAPVVEVQPWKYFCVWAQLKIWGNPSYKYYRPTLVPFWRHLDCGGSVLLLLLDLTAMFKVVSYDPVTHHLVNVEIWGTDLHWLAFFLCSWGQTSLCYPLVCCISQRMTFSWCYLTPTCALLHS